jgi:hypothetical protein
MSPHRGILISRIPAEGVGGLIFALGTTAIFLLAVPAFRPIVAFCLLGGVALAAVLRRVHN